MGLAEMNKLIPITRERQIDQGGLNYCIIVKMSGTLEMDLTKKR